MKTHVILVLDASGSMTPYRGDTVAGYNNYLDELANDTEHEYSVTALKFASPDYMEYMATDAAPAQAPMIGAANYKTMGNTALFDAMVKAISDFQTRVVLGDSDKVLVATLTDGEENASQKITSAEALKVIIKACEDTGRWRFIYLSQGIDSWARAQSMGYSVSDYVGTHSVDSRASYSTVGRVSRGYAGGQSVNVSQAYAAEAGEEAVRPHQP